MYLFNIGVVTLPWKLFNACEYPRASRGFHCAINCGHWLVLLVHHFGVLGARPHRAVCAQIDDNCHWSFWSTDCNPRLSRWPAPSKHIVRQLKRRGRSHTVQWMSSFILEYWIFLLREPLYEVIAVSNLLEVGGAVDLTHFYWIKCISSKIFL